MDRVERHDVINAVALAAVLLAMALGLVWGARALFRTLDGTVDSSKPQTTTSTTATSSTTVAAGAEGDSAVSTTTTIPAPHLPNTVIVRVGNGAGRKGIATVGTDLVAQAGYATIGPKNAPATKQSVVYFVEGYQADAIEVARLLSIPATQIAAMPDDPGVPAAEAHLVVILGSDTTLG